MQCWSDKCSHIFFSGWVDFMEKVAQGDCTNVGSHNVSNILKCHQMGGLKTAGARTQQNGCIGTVCGILKGGNWTSCSLKILRRKKLKRKRNTGKRPEENSESEFIELKLKNSNSIVNFMPTMITMFYCEQYPKVPPNGWSEDSWRKDTTERLHRDSLWHLEGWTTEVKDMSCSEKMVLDFQNTPVAFSSNRLLISLCSVFQQPLSQLRQFFQATTKYGWCRCQAVCGRPYLKNNFGEVLIKFHSTSKRIPDAPRLVCPLKSCSSVWNAIASSKFHGSAVRILKAVPQGVTKPLDLALVALLEQPRTTRM